MSGVLVDTSVWVDHFRHDNKELRSLLQLDLVYIHPLIIGELACGTPPAPRAQTLNDLKLLRQIKPSSLADTMALIEREALHGKGCGLIDIMLLTSVLLTPDAQLWTLDKHLAVMTSRFSIAYLNTTPIP